MINHLLNIHILSMGKARKNVKTSGLKGRDPKFYSQGTRRGHAMQIRSMRDAGRTTDARKGPPTTPTQPPSLLCTRRTASWYRRGERGVVVGGWPSWSPVFPWRLSLSDRYCPQGPCHSNKKIARCMVEEDGRPQEAPPIHTTAPVPTMPQCPFYSYIVGASGVWLRGGWPLWSPVLLL